MSGVEGWAIGLGSRRGEDGGEANIGGVDGLSGHVVHEAELSKVLAAVPSPYNSLCRWARSCREFDAGIVDSIS